MPFAKMCFSTKSLIRGDVLLRRELQRQCDGQVAGQLRVSTFLESFDLVPEGFRGIGDRAVGDQRTDPFRGIGRENKLLMKEPLLAGVVDGAGLTLVFHFRAMPIGSRQNDAAARAAADDAG